MYYTLQILHLRGDGSDLLSENIIKFCEESLSEDTNPNVRILALSVLRLVSPSLTKDDELEKLSEHLNRLALSVTDIPAQQLASQIKQAKPFN